MKYLLYVFLYLKSCNDCIYYKAPIHNFFKKNEIGFCMYYKDYANLMRTYEKKCGTNGNKFNPQFIKIKSCNSLNNDIN